ncbi:3'-5' exonuclease [Variovorax ginsengisoli]|uniref:Ribonuclease D n=1 Tax=Variovorax ginsengisoli TaxID=363844 RepID=A0ABT9SEM4_9BURK|nr:3'-5' exonuclease [Variovorax ginsengisoli]MDP9902223.1 ribonuclease D [Variovorax ginsengisoli]
MNTAPPLLPTREEIAGFDVFPGLTLQDIDVVENAAQAERALAELGALDVVGFDTESKPTFLKNEVSTGPHTVQFASLDRAWVFQVHDPACRAAAGHLIASSAIVKVGFGLAGDRTQIRASLEVEPQALLDLDTVFKRRGYRTSVGVKMAVALMFERRFVKSRKQTTSNWANRKLSEGQICYAANDAFAAMCVADAMDLDATVLAAMSRTR